MNHGFVGELLGKGDGTFQPVGTYDSGGYNAFSVAVEDVNPGTASPISWWLMFVPPATVAPAAPSACCWVMATVPSRQP